MGRALNRAGARVALGLLAVALLAACSEEDDRPLSLAGASGATVTMLGAWGGCRATGPTTSELQVLVFSSSKPLARVVATEDPGSSTCTDPQTALPAYTIEVFTAGDRSVAWDGGVSPGLPDPIVATGAAVAFSTGGTQPAVAVVDDTADLRVLYLTFAGDVATTPEGDPAAIRAVDALPEL